MSLKEMQDALAQAERRMESLQREADILRNGIRTEKLAVNSVRMAKLRQMLKNDLYLVDVLIPEHSSKNCTDSTLFSATSKCPRCIFMNAIHNGFHNNVCFRVVMDEVVDE